jgi:DNA-directed RNA polymerase specialized sigma24 family protein
MQAQRRTHADTDGYELFRRAIVERDEQAWAEGATRYRALLISWAGRCSASAMIGERCDDIADVAFARAWAALSPERFAQFPNLGALMAYLRACVTSAVIDSARSETNFERVAQALDSGAVATPEQIVIDQLERGEVWRIARAIAQTEQERVVLVESYAYDLPPRAILARHPRLFADAAEIYTTKRNLLDRLKRSADMQRLYQERTAA